MCARMGRYPDGARDGKEDEIVALEAHAGPGVQVRKSEEHYADQPERRAESVHPSERY